MNISYNWLNDYIDLSGIPIEELSDILTMKTCEVEGFEPFKKYLDDIVVAKVESLEPHPDADKLNVCQVNDGSQTYQVVCGAPNVKAGKKYPFARIGAKLPGGLEIQKAKLRGVESSGMLCSANELDLTDIIIIAGEDSSAGLLTLTDDFQVGQSLRKALHCEDYIIEIDNKSVTHRPDLWGHFGIARELASLLNKPIKSNPQESVFDESAEVDARHKKPGVQIKDNSAIAYSSAVLANIDIKPSPLKIQARLMAVGMRPINNVVDVSNYVMLELGQPNHAFDREFIKDHIEVSYSKKDETIKLLDSREIKLPEKIVLIRDGSAPVALAGVMGGENTQVSDSTKTVFLESATFHRSDIRAAISKTGVRSESSQRFEKGQDPLNAKRGVYRFAHLLKETCPNLQMGKVDLIETEKPLQNNIKTKISYIKERLGDVETGPEQILNILTSLGMKCNITGDDIDIQVPVYRSYYDITIAEDIIEEIGRVIGYNKIVTQPLKVNCEVPAYKNKQREMDHLLRGFMSNLYQFSEVYNYAFQSSDDISADTRFASSSIKMQNSVNKGLEHLRISPLIGLLRNIAQNYKEYSELRFFELERIFLPKAGEKTEEALPEEKAFLAGIMIAPEKPDIVLTSLYSMVSDLFTRIGLHYNNQTSKQLSNPVFHPGRSGEIINKLNSKSVCKWGQVHPRLSKQYSVDKPVYYFEMFIEDLLEISLSAKPYYRPVVKYPSSDFEFTVLMNSRQPFNELLQVTGEAINRDAGDKTYIEDVEYLDVYEGESIAQGKKAVSARITWRNRTRTLTHDEIKSLQEKLVADLSKAGFTLR